MQTTNTSAPTSGACLCAFILAVAGLFSSGLARAANRPPSISGTPATSVYVGSQYSFRPKASDPEGKTLRFGVANKPGWASFSTSTGRLYGTPQASHVGVYSNIRIRVSDGVNTAYLPAFAITVKRAPTSNTPPVISGTPATSVIAGNTYAFRPSASDANGDPLTFSIANKPGWAAFSTSTGRLSGTPTSSHVGSYANITIRVSDGKATTSLPAFAITVSTNPTPPSNADYLNPYLPYNAAQVLDKAFRDFGTPAKAANLDGYEPWLFDRVSTFWKLWLKTDDTQWRDHALSLFSTYRSQINAQGYFAPTGGDVKYSYVLPFLVYERATGDQQYRPVAKRIYDAWVRDWDGNVGGFWTERHAAYALGAATNYYQLTGDAAALTRAATLFDRLVAISTEGAPLHPCEVHEGYECVPGGLTSPWMGALLAEEVLTYHRVSGDARALTWLAAYADFISTNCLYDGGDEGVPHRVPWYMCGRGDQSKFTSGGAWDDAEHTPDVAGLIAKGIWAKRRLAQNTSTLRATYAELINSAAWVFEEDAGRVSPARKFNWWFSTTYDATYLAQ
jgi:hypothetical protein